MTETGWTEGYRHTQVGWLMLVIGAVAAGFAPVVLLNIPDGPGVFGAVVLAAVAAILIFLFGWLTVIVDGHQVTVRFGIGLIGKRYDLNEFVDVQVVRNKWWYGWGIRAIRKGILYNVNGFDAVELKRPNEKAVRIGTDKPVELKQALREALNALHGSHPDWQAP